MDEITGIRGQGSGIRDQNRALGYSERLAYKVACKRERFAYRVAISRKWWPIGLQLFEHLTLQATRINELAVEKVPKVSHRLSRTSRNWSKKGTLSAK